MKTIVIACIAAAIIAVIGAFALSAAQVTADRGFADSATVRL